jgi:hypothetical protein
MNERNAVLYEKNFGHDPSFPVLDSMSGFSDAQNGPVRPLAALTKGGEPYKRPEAVDIEIGRMLCLHQSEWLANLEELLSETIVYLIREVQQGDKEVFGRLIYELNRRIPRLASRWVRDFDPTTTEEILFKVEKEIFYLVLAPKPTRQSEYLEVAFGQAVKRQTINLVEKYRHNPMVRSGEIVPSSGDYENNEPKVTERPIELAPDDRSGPQATFLEAEGKTLQPELLKQAFDAVKDPVDLKVFKLHHLEGMPIQSSDQNQEDLVRRTGETRRRIKYRLERTMQLIRKALGVSE